MKCPVIYGLNIIKMCLFKIRHPRSLKIAVIQSFEKIRIEINGGGRAEIGSFNQNREKLFVGVYGGKLKIGNHCFFNINNSITCVESIEIGDNCKFGNNLVMVDHDHNFKTSLPEFISVPIKIGNNVWCGANVTILKGTTIGNNCVIGAGSVVKGDIPSNSRIIQKVKKNHDIN